MVITAIALGSFSTGVNNSSVDKAGLVKMLIATSHKTISTGNIHLKYSPGLLSNVNATAIKTIAAKAMPVEMIGRRWPCENLNLSPRRPAIGGVTIKITDWATVSSNAYSVKLNLTNNLGW